MFYKLSVLIRHNLFVRRIIRKIKKFLERVDAITNEKLVSKYAPGKSFAEVGALWGIKGLNSFIAEESGATRVVAIDIYPESKEFLEQKNKRNSHIEFVQGDINLSKTTEKIGVCDVVLCSGVLYHTPDPIHLLMRLRSICGETLILNTASIPEMPGIRNAAVFYPFLKEEQRKIWNRKVGSQKAITGPYEPEEGYANWFWGLLPVALSLCFNARDLRLKSVLFRLFFPYSSAKRFLQSSWQLQESGIRLTTRNFQSSRNSSPYSFIK